MDRELKKLSHLSYEHIGLGVGVATPWFVCTVFCVVVFLALFRCGLARLALKYFAIRRRQQNRNDDDGRLRSFEVTTHRTVQVRRLSF